MSTKRRWPGILWLGIAILAAVTALFWNLLAVLFGSPTQSGTAMWSTVTTLFRAWTDGAFWWRAAAVTLAIAGLSVHGHYLSRPHSTFRTREILPQVEFGEMDSDAMLLSLARERTDLSAQGLTNRRVLMDLISQVVLQRTRSRASEEITIMPNVLERAVSVRSNPAKHRRFLVASKPRKGSNFRDFRLESGDLEVVDFHKAQALLFECAKLLGSAAKGGVLNFDEQIMIVDCVTAATESDQKAARLAVLSWSGAAAGDVNAKLVFGALMSVVAERRPILVGVAEPGGELGECRFRYAEPVLKPDEGTSVPLSRWMSWARSARAWWGAAPKLMSIPLPRALTSQRFKVLVNAPKGTYMRDVGLWDYERESWYPNLDRERFFTVFTGHQVLPGMRRAQAVISSTSDQALAVVRSPRLAVRVSEIPPGSIGAGALLSLSVWLLTWLFGAFFPNGNSQFFDLAALAFALPGSVFAVFSLNTRESPYASLTARISSMVSLALSFFAILLLVVAQKSPSLITQTNLTTSVMLATNGIWLTLVTIGLVNAVWSSLDLMRAFFRYRALRNEEFNFYGRD